MAILARTAVQKFVQMLMQAIAVNFLFTAIYKCEASPSLSAFSMFLPDRPDLSLCPSPGLTPTEMHLTLFTHPPITPLPSVINERAKNVSPGMMLPSCNLYAQQAEAGELHY